jgi:hypothetical protein
MLAADMIFGDTAADWTAREIYPLSNIVADAHQAQQISTASRVLRAVPTNAALLLHEQQADPEEVVRYLMRYSLCNEQEARQRLRFISDPLWRAYIFTYTAGYMLLKRWLHGGDQTARFRTLLTEQIYPSLIEGWIIEEERTCVRD